MTKHIDNITYSNNLGNKREKDARIMLKRGFAILTSFIVNHEGHLKEGSINIASFTFAITKVLQKRSDHQC